VGTIWELFKNKCGLFLCGVASDANDFITLSGWFSFPSLPHCKEALQHVLAKKCKMNYDDFLACKEAVYYLDYINGEKVTTDKHILS